MKMRGFQPMSARSREPTTGVGRSTAHRSIRSGSVSHLVFSRRILIPTAGLLAMLHLDDGRSAT